MNEYDETALAAAKEHLLEHLRGRLQQYRAAVAPQVQEAVDGGGGRDEIEAILRAEMEGVVAEIDELVAAFVLEANQLQ